MLDTYEKTIQLHNAIWFLNNHPALNALQLGSFTEKICWWTYCVCKNNECLYNEDDPKSAFVKIFKDEDPDRYAKYFDIAIRSADYYIDVPYTSIYGYQWEYHKTVWACEYNIYMYVGNKSDPKFDYWSRHNWIQYAGNDIYGADSFEDLIIEIAKDVEKNFGNFDKEDFYTKKEKERCDKDSKIKDFIKYMKKAKFIDDSVINKRWWKWYKTTPHYKEKWVNVIRVP